MKNHYDSLLKLLKDTARARQDMKRVIAKLNSSKKDYSPEYIEENIEPQIIKAQAGMKATHQAAFVEASEYIEALRKLATEKEEKLDLSSPALSNALKVIELSGPDISGDTVRKINESFKGDQSSLRMLRDVYKAKGVLYDGGLDAQIYEPESAIEHLGEWAYYSLIQEGSLNEFAYAINKVASMEGIDFPKIIDEAGAIDAMRSAAGLPDKVEKGE